MEQNKPMAANTQIGQHLKDFDKADKVLIVTTTSKYNDAKRNRGDTVNAYKNLVNLIRQMETKYGIVIFGENAEVPALINEFAEKIEQATNTLLGEKNYTCTFKSVEEANTWLAVQNNMQIKDFLVDVSRAGLDVTRITIVYGISGQATNKKYQITEFRKHRFFVGSKHEKVRQKWQEQNPQFAYVKSLKFKWGFSLMGSSVGFFRYIKEKYVFLYTL